MRWRWKGWLVLRVTACTKANGLLLKDEGREDAESCVR